MYDFARMVHYGLFYIVATLTRVASVLIGIEVKIHYSVEWRTLVKSFTNIILHDYII